MTREIAFGMITPSGNRTVERVTQAICAGQDGLVPLFTRIPVHGHTSPDKPATGTESPYDWPAMIAAATLLGHAEPAAICWNGSKGGDHGFDIDERLCGAITAATGIPAVTSALATLDLLKRLGARRIALLTPYAQAAQERTAAQFAAKGFEVVAGRCSGLTDNLSYGSVAPAEIALMARAALADTRPDAVVAFCTNFNAAPVAAALEAESGVPFVDSTAAGVWAALKAAGFDARRIAGWGRIFGL